MIDVVVLVQVILYEDVDLAQAAEGGGGQGRVDTTRVPWLLGPGGIRSESAAGDELFWRNQERSGGGSVIFEGHLDRFVGVVDRYVGECP